YMGLCPFHNERTPSFSVNPRRNICHCFSCGKGGSPVNFIMEKENISYYDALKQLARKYGIKVEERELTPEERRLATEREGLLIAAEAAMKIMEEDLISSQEGKDIGLTYFYHRGVTDEAIKAFHLGYSIDKGSYITSAMLNNGFDMEILRALGLTGVSQNGDCYDKYRGRVIFPIMNSSGKTVGFGGRDLKGSRAKYINSPESVLYHKNNELYGIYQAKNEIVRENNCFLVEGYLDVISMWQAGLKNVVASSGTSLTDGQIAIIHRFTSNITLVYDGDEAGIKAALRGIDMLLSHKMKVSVLLLPDGHDPDSFAKVKTPEELREYVKKYSCDIIRFKMNVLMKEIGDDPRKKGEVVNSVVESIACIPEYVDRMIYVGECSRSLHIDEKAIVSAVEKARIRKIEQMKLDRRKNELNRKFPESQIKNTNEQLPVTSNITGMASDQTLSNGPTPENRPTTMDNPSDTQEADFIESIRKSEILRQNPMRPLEKRLIELAIKYGYLGMPSNADSDVSSGEDMESGNSAIQEDNYFILDFIADELAADKVEFSVAEFQHVYNILLSSVDEYLIELGKEKEKISSLIENKRRKGHLEIASSAGSLNDIERAELKLENDLKEEYYTHLREFARYYPGNMLASHENDSVRSVANEMIYEKYVLSSIYSAASDNTKYNELEEVMRAITEWKSEILNEMLNKLMKELRNLSLQLDNTGSEDRDVNTSSPTPDIIERMQRIQQKITSVMVMRSQIAKDIGERVLCPRKIR
ncbi:MAG: DNA primase, partial [Muribaculaceae bacterium]|nr:DNA primase [Muribaculaceae bacterium]